MPRLRFLTGIITLMSNYEESEYGRCTATAKHSEERCKRAAIGDHGKCGYHGGKTPTKDENPDVGASEGDLRALKTGLHADPVNLFNWLLETDRDAAVWVLNKLHSYSQQAPRAVYEADVRPAEVDSYDDVTLTLTAYGDDVLLMCIRDYARWRGTRRQLKEGLLKSQEAATDDGTVWLEDSNPVNLDLDRMDKTTIRQKDKLGLLPSPSKEAADAQKDLAQILADE